MAKDILVIDISADEVSAGLFAGTGGSPKGIASAPLSGEKGLAGAVESALGGLREKGLLKGDPADSARVLLSVGPESLHLRVVDVPFSERVKINETLPLELSGVLAVDVADTVLDSVPLGPGRALAVAAEKDWLGHAIRALEAAGADPVWVGPGHFALAFTAEKLGAEGGGSVAVVSPAFISVSDAGKPLYMNYFEGERGLGLQTAFARSEGLEPASVVIAGEAPADMAKAFPGAGVAEVKLPEGVPPVSAHLYAVALMAEEGTLKDLPDFRKGELVYTRERARTRRKLAFTAVLVAAIALILAGDLYMRYLSLERELATYEQAVSDGYRALFSGEDGGADPLYRLRAKMKELTEEAGVLTGGVSPLDVMDEIAGAAGEDPSMGVVLRELTVGEGKARAAGSAASFEAANRFKGLLEKREGFSSVILSDVKSRGGETVFSLTINLRGRA